MSKFFTLINHLLYFLKKLLYFRVSIIIVLCILLPYPLQLIKVQLFSQTPQKQASDKNNIKKKDFDKTIYITTSPPPKSLTEKPDEISIQQGENKTENRLSDILEKQSGLTINRYGGPGSFSRVSVRGSDSHQVNIYIEGILLNSSLGGGVNIEELPVNFFSSLELYRSYTPIHLSGANTGGALDLRFDLPLKKDEENFFFHFFANGLKGGGLGLGWANQNQIHFIDIEGSLNEYYYLNNKGTNVINFQDDQIQARENEGYFQGSYTNMLYFPFSEKSIRLIANYFGKQRQVPGPMGTPLKKVRYSSHRLIIKPSYEHVFSDHFILSILPGFSGGFTQLKDPSQELSFLLSEQERYNLRGDIQIQPVFFLFSEKLIINTSLGYSYDHLYLESQDLASRSEWQGGVSLKFTPLYWLGYISFSGKYIYMLDKPYSAFQNLILINHSLKLKYKFSFNSSDTNGVLSF